MPKRRRVKEGSSLAERLAFYSAPDANGCLIWNGIVRRDGDYGRLQIGTKMYSAHRLAYELKHGAIPNGLMVLHRCDVRLCINPDHLFLGSNQENMDDMKAKGRHAPRTPRGSRHGHAKLTEEQVLAIRASIGPQHIIAQQFGVSKPTVGYIRRRQTWKHLP